MKTLLAVALLASIAAEGGRWRVHASPQTATASAELQKLDDAFGFVRARNARDYAITTPNGIDEGRFVTIGGIEQWITIRGEDRHNPVLLFVHGGPGDATNPWGYAAFRLWLKHFTVVQWDQRGTGRTLGKNRAADTISIERLVQDGLELSDQLRKTLGKERIVLVGHSFGSMLGVLMAKARPELFYAFIGTGQVGDSTRNYSVAYDALLRKATAIGERQALSELKAVGPPPYADGRGFGVQRKWANFFEGADAFIASMLGFALSAPGYTVRDINDWFEGQGVSAEHLVPESRALDANALGGEFHTPVFVIQGAEDFTTPTSLAKSFVGSVRAPHKAFVTIDGGHFAVFTHSRQFVDQLLTNIRPLAVR